MMFRRHQRSEVSVRLYSQARALGRTPMLFGAGRLQDDFEGRFEALVMGLTLVMVRLSAEAAGDGGRVERQEMMQLLVADIDDGLRNTGVSDVRIGRRVKDYTRAALGRAEGYTASLAALDCAMLAAAVRRNAFRRLAAPEDEAAAVQVAAWMLKIHEALGAMETQTFLQGEWELCADAL